MHRVLANVSKPCTLGDSVCMKKAPRRMVRYVTFRMYYRLLTPTTSRDPMGRLLVVVGGGSLNSWCVREWVGALGVRPEI
jgi:hypothetical protein